MFREAATVPRHPGTLQIPGMSTCPTVTGSGPRCLQPVSSSLRGGLARDLTHKPVHLLTSLQGPSTCPGQMAGTQSLGAVRSSQI